MFANGLAQAQAAKALLKWALLGAALITVEETFCWETESIRKVDNYYYSNESFSLVNEFRQKIQRK